MSSLLKEAIVDAKALRESALKSAETSIIEKYSDEVKSALNSLLEQEELAPEGGAAPKEDIVKNVPLSATDNLCEEDGEIPNGMSKEGEDIPVKIDLDALQEAVAALEAELNEEETEEINEESEDEINEDEEIEINEEDLAALFEEEDDLDERMKFKSHPDQQDITKPKGYRSERDKARMDDYRDQEDERERGDAKARKKMQEEDHDDDDVSEEIDTDSLVDAIMEKLTVDMGAELAGWAGRSSDDMKHEIEKELAHRRSTDVEEEMETLKKAQEELVFENKQLNEHLSQHKQVVQELKESLQDVNLSNARLLYTNRVLRNTSLNERQKEKIVEAISNAGSVTEAKVIYETLQSTVETKPKRSPQSLSEAISNKRSSVIRATRQESTPSDPLQERMKRLAGIK